MQAKWIRVYGMLAVLLCVAPILVVAQSDSRRFRPERGREEPGRDWPRGEIQVTNDWENDVKVTVWTHRRERISGHWMLEPGVTTVLAVDGDRIRVRPTYKIKVGDDWGWVDIGEVGQFSWGTWYVNVRDVWRATHQGRGRGVPDWKR